MTTLYLHIGMPKTGTTHLQHFLRINAPVLNKYGFAYPIFNTRYAGKEPARNGQFLKHRFYDENGKRDKAKEGRLVESHFERLGRIAKKFDNIILSEESIWNDRKFSWKKFKEKTDEMGFDVKIIVYLRRQDSYIQSYWAQMVQVKYSMTFDEYINENGYDNIYTDYYSRLQKIAKYIGKDNIIVRIYEKSAFGGTKNTITSDFLDAIGLEETDEYETTNKLINPSLSGIYLETKRILNKHPEIAVQKSAVSKMLASIMLENNDLVDYNKSQLFDYKGQVKFLKQFKESNQKIAREYLNRKELFNEKPIKNKNCRVTYSADDLVDICGKMLVQQNNQIKELKKAIKEKDKLIESLKTESK